MACRCRSRGGDYHRDCSDHVFVSEANPRTPGQGSPDATWQTLAALRDPLPVGWDPYTGGYLYARLDPDPRGRAPVLPRVPSDGLRPLAGVAAQLARNAETGVRAPRTAGAQRWVSGQEPAQASADSSLLGWVLAMTSVASVASVLVWCVIQWH